MGRRRKKFTYDSKETKVVYGVILILISILFFLSYITSDTPLFTVILRIFGEVRFFIGLFLLNLGLYFLNREWNMSTVGSLISQLFFTLALALLLNSFVKEWDVYKIAETGSSGGLLGYYLRTPLEPILSLAGVQIIAIIILVITTPLSFSVSLGDFFGFFVRILSAIGEWIQKAFERMPEMEDKTVAKETSRDRDRDEETTEMLGDFRKEREEEHRSNNKKVVEDDEIIGDEHDDEDDALNQPKVEVKEVSSEGAFVNTELQFPDWELPPVDLLNPYKKFKPAQEDIKKNSQIIEQTLGSFGIKARVVDVLIGPSVTQFALDIALGTKVSKIQNLSTDLALALAVASNSIRIEAPIPGTSYVGIEVPNSNRQFINFREIVEGGKFKNTKDALPAIAGKDINGEDIITNIQKMPHLLIAGATGSGKSILTNTFIMSLLMKKTPDEVRMIMVDPKQVELSDYNGIPHLLTPVITDMAKVINALKWLIVEMENRYTIFRENKVRNIEGFNELMGFSSLPYIVVVIDEMADMMMTGGAEIEGCIVRLAQKARATGIHLILATQRPSVDVITGLIKANIPGRIGLSVATQIDSRVIMDQIGAEALLGKGDMLLKEPDKSKPFRVQGVWTAPDEIQRVVKFIKEQVPEVEYKKEVVEGVIDPSLGPGAKESSSFSDDELFAQAVRVVVQSGKGSSSLIQRKLSVGYNRAARLLDELYKYGVVGAEKGSKPRDVLISDAESFLAGGSNQED